MFIGGTVMLIREWNVKFGTEWKWLGMRSIGGLL
jgi:hypothetical protein